MESKHLWVPVVTIVVRPNVLIGAITCPVVRVEVSFGGVGGDVGTIGRGVVGGVGCRRR